jgi:PEP-CTERM motif
MSVRFFFSVFVGMLFTATINTQNAGAATFSFSFTSDGTELGLNDPNTPGITSGLIFGLNENGSGQIPTAIEIVSSPIGHDGSLDVANGQITASNGLYANLFFAPSDSSTFYLNDKGDSALSYCSTSCVQTYNDAGFAGITFAEVTTAVPEPSTWAMLILGFFGIGAMTYRRRKSATLAA